MKTKELYVAQKNYLQCAVAMAVVGLLLLLWLDKKAIGIGCLVLAGLFAVGFIILLIKNGLRDIPEDELEAKAKRKNKNVEVSENKEADVNLSKDNKANKENLKTTSKKEK